MRIRTAIRKFVKWGGAALAVVLLVVWIGSAWYGVISPGFGRQQVGVLAGTFFWQSYVDPDRALPAAFFSRPTRKPFTWRFRYMDGDDGFSFLIPLWFPLLLTIIPTGFAWRPDIIARRRSRRGACMKCGYARSGLAAGAVCPECGTAPAAAGAAAKA